MKDERQMHDLDLMVVRILSAIYFYVPEDCRKNAKDIKEAINYIKEKGLPKNGIT